VPWFVIMKIFEPILNIVCECMNITASSYQSSQAQQESALARAGARGAACWRQMPGPRLLGAK
jgi:hypothetical protein